MILTTFVITTHSQRFENLKQTIRFLVKRESSLLTISELIVVCQDKIDYTNSDFAEFKLINLEMNHYCHPVMKNRAAAEAKGKFIVFLDGDRILPPNWFKTQLDSLKDKNMVISAHRLYRLNMPATDDQIEENLVPKLEDYRIADMGTISQNMRHKSVFSGNAVMLKDDYLDLGGMDESFVGYGFSDTDFSYKIYKAGIKIVLTSDDELHLYHPVDIDLALFAKMNFDNALKFCKKWKVTPSIHWKKLWQAYHNII